MKKILSSCSFFLFLVFVISSIYQVFAWKDTSEPYVSVKEQLYATGDDLMDLVFIGSSHIYCTTNPACFWNEAGISSFDLAISMMDKTSSKYYLQELFKTQSPSVVCLELYALQYSRQNKISHVYRNYLSLKPTLASVQAILEHKPEGNLVDYFLQWPIIHTRYQELQVFDFVQYQPSIFGRGYNYYFAVQPAVQNQDAVSTSMVTELSQESREWLDAMINLCEQNGSRLITIISPMVVSEEWQAVYNGAKQYLSSRGIECLDLNQSTEDIGLDYATDFKDEGHLNAWGAKKVSSYLLKELTSRYTFTDHRGDPDYALWEENSRYDAYQWKLQSFLQVPEDDLDGALKALADCNGLSLIVSFPPDYSKEGSDWVRLFTELGAKPEQITEGGQWILQEGQVLAYVPANDGAPATVNLNEADTVTLNPQGTTLFNGSEMASHPDAFTLAVYDTYTYEMIAERYYP